MNLRSFVLVCVIAALCVLSSACAGNRPIKYYRIEVPSPPPAAAEASFGVTLQIGNIDAPPLMRDGRILYEIGANEIGAYEYHRWVETPDRMVQNSLVRLLRSSGRYPAVDTPRSNLKPDYMVHGRIYEFSEIDKPEIHTRVSMEIELQDVKSGRTVWSRLYTHDDPVSGKEVSDVVESLDRNLRQGLSEIVPGLNQYFVGRATAAPGK